MTSLESRLQTALRGRYTITRELGRGGMSTVFLAEDLRHKRAVALKVLGPEIARTVGPERFMREIEIAAQLTHPHILPVFDSGEADGLLFYAMPYAPGGSLRARLTREPRLPVGEAVEIARDVADALDYAHRRGIVHRDIKPENVLFEEGHAIVADFGIARALAGAADGPRLTGTGLAIGTPQYMSPEQSAGESSVDGRTDLYALGCVLYEMLAGRSVFEGPSAQSVARQHLTAAPERLRGIRPEVPAALERVIERALAKDPADRWPTGAELSGALARAVALPAGAASRWRALGGYRVLAGVALVAALGAFMLLRRPRGPIATRDLVAVAPFDVLVPELGLWREGLVDVLSQQLDGAGPIRAVPPSVVVRRWSGPPDARSAAALGRATGAGLAVFGQVLGAGRDSVRVTATVWDVAANRALGEVEIRNVSGRMDRIADSVTVAVLRVLATTRPIGAVRSMSLGGRSLPALKAFLAGEQFYRRTDWDSALAYYNRAIALDTGFALAYRRVELALGWQHSGADSLSRAYGLRAAALNHGLAPRESLLIASDSLCYALFGFVSDTAFWDHARRVFAMLGEATRRYPDDPEVWYALGDAQYHFGFVPFGATGEQALASFDRSIALDSAYGPSYIHPVELALRFHGPAAAGRYVRGYLALDPTDINAAGIRIVGHLLDPSEAQSPATERLLDSVPPFVLQHAGLSLMRWPDSAETAVRVQRVLARRAPGPTGFDVGTNKDLLGLELLYRGHVREALRVVPGNPLVVAAAAGLGIVTPESANAILTPLVRSQSPFFGAGLPWWASRGDTVHLLAARARADSLASRPSAGGWSRLWRYSAAAVRAYLTLARRDTAEALAQFVALPDSLCPFCYFERLIRVELLVARGREREAVPVLDLPLINPIDPGNVLLALEGGRIYARLGDRPEAVTHYQFVADVWRHADPEFEPYVREARAALKELTGERR